MPEESGPVSQLGQRLDELDRIVRALEDDPAMSLDDAIRLYESARKLSQSCHADLSRARLRLVEIDASLAAEAEDGGR